MAKRAPVADLDTASLEQRLAEAKQELFNLRFQNATGQLENSSALRSSRREIARVATELRAREIEAAEQLARNKEV